VIVAVMEVEPPVLVAVMVCARCERISVGFPLIMPVEGFRNMPLGRALEAVYVMELPNPS
jgi:hypothetical protein